MRVVGPLIIPVLVLAGACSAFGLGLFERLPKLAGTVIPRPSAAPDFTLTDQHGLPFHMADTKGRVVVMTFIYTHCTDICPFIALKIKSAHDLLGKDADKAVFVAVTTDPERDTQKVIAAYSKAVGLVDAWHYVTGPLVTVRQVWFNYGVGVEIEKPEGAHQDDPEGEGHSSRAAHDADPPAQGLSTQEVDKVWQIVDEFGGGYEVGHSAPFWFIDRQGRIRASMDADALPSDIAFNVRSLMTR